jgi:hypothetical protein
MFFNTLKQIHFFPLLTSNIYIVTNIYDRSTYDVYSS